MQIIKTDKYIKLIADEGKRITCKGREFFSEFIFLPPTANIDSYEEVGREIWKHFIKEEDPSLNEIKEIVSSLEEGQVFLEETLLDTDYRLLDLELEVEFGEEI